MIIIHWTVPLLAVVLGATVAYLAATRLGNRVDALLLDRVDALVLARTDEVLTAVLREVLRGDDAAADPGLPPAVDPWSSWQTLHDGLPELKEPDLPKHPWLRDPTGQLQVLPPAEPEVAAVVVEEEPKASLRERFEGEPKLPKEITVAAVIPDTQVKAEKVAVTA